MFLSVRTSLMIQVIRVMMTLASVWWLLTQVKLLQSSEVLSRLSHSPLSPLILPRNLNHGTLIGSSGIYKLPADWVSLPINWVLVRDWGLENEAQSVSDRLRSRPSSDHTEIKMSKLRLPLNLPSPASWTGCFLKHEKINSEELLSFKQHSKEEGQAKLNPKTAKRSQHSMKDRRENLN